MIVLIVYNYVVTILLLGVIAWIYWRTRLTAPLAFVLWQLFMLLWSLFKRGMGPPMGFLAHTIDVALLVWLMLALLHYSPAASGEEGEESRPAPPA